MIVQIFMTNQYTHIADVKVGKVKGRDYDLVFTAIDDFFNKEEVSPDDEIVFTFAKKTYTAISKVLLITK